jgi:hypothetical protein
VGHPPWPSPADVKANGILEGGGHLSGDVEPEGLAEVYYQRALLARLRRLLSEDATGAIVDDVTRVVQRVPGDQNIVATQ